MGIHKKGAIELSMNFFVILIISIVVFGSGLSLFWKIYAAGEEQLGSVSRSVEQQIIRQLHGGTKVSIVPRELELTRNDEYMVGIGINNLMTSEETFKIFVEPGLFVSEDGAITCSFEEDYQGDKCDGIATPVPPLVVLGSESSADVLSNKQYITNILVKSPKNAFTGRYVLNLCVCYGGCFDYASCIADPYDSNYPISKIRVETI